MPLEVKLQSVVHDTEDVNTMSTLDTLFANYHKQMWYYQWMFSAVMKKYLFSNALALVSIAVGMIASAFGGYHDHDFVDSFRHPGKRLDRLPKVSGHHANV